MYQKLVLYVFSNETFPLFFAKVEEDWSSSSPLSTLRIDFLIQYFTHSEASIKRH